MAKKLWEMLEEEQEKRRQEGSVEKYNNLVSQRNEAINKATQKLKDSLFNNKTSTNAENIDMLPTASNKLTDKERFKNALDNMDSETKYTYNQMKRNDGYSSGMSELAHKTGTIVENTGLSGANGLLNSAQAIKRDSIVKAVADFQAKSGMDSKRSEEIEKEIQDLQNLKEGHQKIIEKNINDIKQTGDGFATKLAELAPSVGQQVPGILLNTISPLASFAYFKTSAEGSYYDDAKARGMNEEQSKIYSKLMSWVEAGTDQISLGNISKGGKTVKSLIKGTGKEVAKEGVKATSKEILKSALKDYAIGIGENAFQEAITEPLQELSAQVIAGEDKADWNNIWQRIVNAGVDGGLVSAIIGGANLGYASCTAIVEKINNNKTVTKTEIGKAINDISNELDVPKMIVDSTQQQIDKAQNIINENSLPVSNEQNSYSNKVNQIQQNNIQNEVLPVANENNNLANNQETLYNTYKDMKIGETKNISLNEVLKLQDRMGYRTEEEINNLREYVKQNGLENNPIELVRLNDGTIKIEDGNHRLQIAKELGMESIPVKFVESWENVGLKEDINSNNINERIDVKYDGSNRDNGQINRFDVESRNNEGSSESNSYEFENGRATERNDRVFNQKSENNKYSSSEESKGNNRQTIENSNQSSFSNTPAERVEWNDIQKPEGKFRKHYQSIIESSNTTAEAKAIAKKLMGLDTYIPDSNKSQIERADAFIEKYGVDKAMERLMTNVENESVTYDGTFKKVGVDDVALGERLIQYYSKTGDAVQLQNAIQATAMAGTYAGRMVQAFNILNHQTPQGQVTWIQRTVDKVNSELKNKRGDKAPQFEFTPEMQQKIMNTTTQEEMFNVINEVYEELGQQVPKSFTEKIDSWRYFSMLANPKTHIRNIVGNIAMGKMQSVKNKVAGVIEDTVGLFNKDMERHHTLKPASKEVKEFAKLDLKNLEVQTGLELNDSKYNPKSRIENAQRTFKTEQLEKTVGKAFEINEKALEVEDAWGLKSAYVKSLSEYMTANKLTPDTITDQQLAKARKYAIAEAKEATFHSENAIATAINQFSRKNKLTKFATDAVLPFVKTPMNVAKAGMEYNPVGLIKTLTVDSVKLRKGDITVNKYIDNLSKGLTGTGLAVLGYAMADAGILKSSGGDDDKKENYDEALGKQSYSLEINGKTYSLDWLAPAGIPLFVGAEAFNINNASKNEKKSISSDDNSTTKQVINSLENWANAMANSMSPMSEMSMISGLTSALKSYDQDSTKMLGQIGTNAVKSYVNQFVPTALGQVAKTTDEYERSTTSTKTGVLSKAIDQTRLQVMSKIPGLREQLPVKTDVWGNEQKQEGNIVEKAIKNSILPFTTKEVINTAVDKELNSLYDKTGESSILPSTSLDKTFTIDGQTYRMTNEEYSKYRKSYGQTSYKLLNSLVTSKDYKNSTDEQKQKAIENVYKYAKEKNKQDYVENNKLEVKPSTLYTTMEALKSGGGNQSSYLNYLGKTTGIEKEKEKNQILKDASYDNKTKSIIYENTTGKDDKSYSLIKATGLNINNYLGYKIAVANEELKADRKDDGTEKGKAISGSAKAKVVDYINNMPNTTYTQRMVLYGLNYKPDRKSDRELIVNYVNSLNNSKDEKNEMLHRFSWITFYKDGTFNY